MSQPVTAATAAPPDPRRWKALALLCVAAFLVILDAQIVNIAVPSIGRSLAFPTGTIQWVLSAYGLAFGGLLLLGGRAADLFGRRQAFMVGVGLFALASLVCGLAWSWEVLVAARVVQGISAAIMSPAALSIVMTSFQEGPERNKALGIWGGTSGLGGTAGALVGGPLTSGLGWEWIFFINVPIGAVLLALSPFLLRESRARTRGNLDLGGAATVTAALILLVYGVAEAPAQGWASPRTIGLLAASVALFGVFVLIESRSANPLVPLRIFRSRTLVGGNLVAFGAGMAAYGQSFILTLYAQEVLGYSPIQFGLMTAVLPVTAVIGSFVGQHLVTRAGFRGVAAVSMALIGIGCLLLTQLSADGGYLQDILPGLLVFGPGLGAGTVAASIAALANVSERDAGLASGFQNAAFQVGGALGVALVSTVAILQSGGGTGGVALTEGYRSAFVVEIGFAVLGLLAALTLLGAAKAGRAPGGGSGPANP